MSLTPGFRQLLLPFAVVLLTIGALVTVLRLQDRARASVAAQLELARIRADFNALQGAPFRASKTFGGDPAVARNLMDTGRQSVDQALGRLLREAPPSAVRELVAPLAANYATLEKIYRAGGYGAVPDRLLRELVVQTATTRLAFARGRDAYARRADSANVMATVGTIVVITFLLLGFGVLYRRSVLSRAIAERLAVENRRLLEDSRVEALTDALTTLPNRRALIRDLDAAVSAAERGHAHVVALFDLDGFKHYNDTLGHPAGDALLHRLGVRLRSVVDGRGTAYRMGGDEFCVLAPAGTDDGASIVADACAALSESAGTSKIHCSSGHAVILAEATTAKAALQLADERLYGDKVTQAARSERVATLRAGSPSAGRASPPD